MNSMERVLRVIDGGIPDRLPIWASRHNKDGFLADTSEGLLKREIEFQEEYDWDMARISPVAALQVEDFGCTFTGNNYLGVPTPVTRPVNSIEDWSKIKRLDPQAGQYATIAKAIKGLSEYLKGSKLNLATAFSPLTLAQKVAGTDILLETMRKYPEVLENVLDIFADTMIDFIQNCVDNGADGLYYCTQTATYQLLTDQEAERFERPFSLKILNAVKPRLKAVILHLHGDKIMIRHFENYPIDVLNWADRRTIPPVPLSKGIKYFSRCVMGGINGRTTLYKGTKEEIENEVIDSWHQVGKPFIIAPCCVIPVKGLPSKNLHAYRNVVDKIKL